jgi:hypothetical protein
MAQSVERLSESSNFSGDAVQVVQDLYFQVDNITADTAGFWTAVIVESWPTERETMGFGKKPRQQSPMYFVFCRLYPFSLPANTVVFGSYLSSLYS